MADGIPNFDQLHAINLFNYLPRAAGVIPQGRGSLVANPAPAQVVAPAPVQVAAPVAAAPQNARANFAASVNPPSLTGQPVSSFLPTDISSYLPSIAGNFLAQPGHIQAQKDFQDGRVLRGVGGEIGALFKDVGNTSDTLKSRIVEAPLRRAAAAGSEFTAGLRGVPPEAAPAAAAATPLATPSELSGLKPAAGTERAFSKSPQQDSPAIQHFKAYAEMMRGLTRGQIAEFSKNYPRVMPIDPKNMAISQYTSMISQNYALKKDALKHSNLQGKELEDAGNVLDSQYAKDMGAVFTTNFTMLGAGAGVQ